MSPEQAEGRLDQLGPASDVYSLGAVLYTLLCGKTPFEYVWCDVTALIDRVRLGEFPAPRKVNAQVPRELEAVCLKAMATRPEHRYASATDLAAGDQAVAGRRAGRMLSRARAGAAGAVGPAAQAGRRRRGRPLAHGGGRALGGNRPSSAASSTRPRPSGWRPCTSASWSPRKPNHSAAATRSAASTSRIANTSMTTSPWPTSSWTAARQTSRSGNGTTPAGWGIRSSRPSRARARVKTSGRWRFHPTAQLLACGSGPWSYVGDGPTGELLVRSVQTGAEVFALRGLTGAVQALAFSPDGRQLAAAWGFTGKDQGRGARRLRHSRRTQSVGEAGARRPDPQPGVLPRRPLDRQRLRIVHRLRRDRFRPATRRRDR